MNQLTCYNTEHVTTCYDTEQRCVWMQNRVCINASNCDARWQSNHQTAVWSMHLVTDVLMFFTVFPHLFTPPGNVVLEGHLGYKVLTRHGYSAWLDMCPPEHCIGRTRWISWLTLSHSRKFPSKMLDMLTCLTSSISEHCKSRKCLCQTRRISSCMQSNTTLACIERTGGFRDGGAIQGSFEQRL